MINDNPNDVAPFEMVSANDPKTIIRLIRDGGAGLSKIFPRPMTEAQAAAWLADLYL